MTGIGEQFEAFTKALEVATTFDEVIKVCLAIDNTNSDEFAEHYKNDTQYELIPSAKKLVRKLCDAFQSSKDLNIHLRIMKSIMRPGLCMQYMQVEFLLNEYANNTNAHGAECLKTYAWLQNFNFIKKYGVGLCNTLEIHQPFVASSLKYSNDTKYFKLAIENYILAYDHKVITENDSFLFTVILTNLENPHRGVRTLLLDLFRRVMKCYKKKNRFDETMIEDIIELPWTNRNKYPLMATVLSCNFSLLMKNPKFQMASLAEGLQIALKIHHLLAPSQCLVKAIQASDAVFRQKCFEAIAEVFWKGDNQVVDNAIKYWINPLEPKSMDLLFNIIKGTGRLEKVPTTSPNFYRILMLKHAMCRQFKDNELESRIKDFSCIIEELPLKTEILYILMDLATNEPNEVLRLENVLSLLSFLRYNMCLPESNFIEHHVMRLLPNLFNLLALMKMRKVDVLKEVFGIIKNDLYLHGIELGSYESTMFSLKLLQIMLKLYFGSEQPRKGKKPAVEGSLMFGKYLKDNEIWDLTSSSIFLQLLKIANFQDSDVSDLAVDVLVEYFIKTSRANVEVEGMQFYEWTKKKVLEEFNSPDISTGYVAKRFFIMQFELRIPLDSAVHELMLITDLLKNRFMAIKKSSDPVHSMQESSHLFKILDCITFAINRLNPNQIKFELFAVMNVLLKLISFHFLDLISDESVPPTFEILDQKLLSLMDKSAANNFDPSELKSKLLFFIWYTLRSCSELSEGLATIANKVMRPSDKEYNQVMTTCLDINMQMLIRCCHKGVIDSASVALGKIAKIISKEFSNLCVKTSPAGKNLHGLLVKMKNEINCGKRARSEIEDIRCSRGLMVMSFHLISSHPAFLRFLMDSLIVSKEIQSFGDTQAVKFIDNIKPIQLHLLAFLIRDGELAEDMLKHYNFILLATFKAYKESKNYVVINGLLQVIGAIVPKISKQKSHLMGEEESTLTHYEPKAVTVYELYVKLTYAYRIALFDLAYQKEPPSIPYTLILLEIFSKFEYRNNGEHYSEVESLRSVFEKLLSHECEKIRILAGRCFANWHATDDKMLKVIKRKIGSIFSDDENEVHSASHYLRYMIQRYESSKKCIGDFDAESFKASLRDEVCKHSGSGFDGAINFFIRYHLLEFLMFLGFPFNHEVVQKLTIEDGLKSHFGFKLWSEKLKELQM